MQGSFISLRRVYITRKHITLALATINRYPEFYKYVYDFVNTDVTLWIVVYYIGSAEGHEYPDLQVGDEVNPRQGFIFS